MKDDEDELMRGVPLKCPYCNEDECDCKRILKLGVKMNNCLPELIRNQKIWAIDYGIIDEKRKLNGWIISFQKGARLEDFVKAYEIIRGMEGKRNG